MARARIAGSRRPATAPAGVGVVASDTGASGHDTGAYGLIEGHVLADDAPDAGLAWT
ncbi:MAG TPA: hypothetical protein VMG38_06530 [Trebonia sp.]|nr:hypothetical protein [Trebonia sp.]